nr:MAG TPA: hypothetical protein [Caudoviricetes sp.]
MYRLQFHTVILKNFSVFSVKDNQAKDRFDKLITRIL